MKNEKMFNADSNMNAFLVHSLQKNVSNNRSMKNTFPTTMSNNMNVMSTNTNQKIAKTVFDSNAQAKSISNSMKKSNLFVRAFGVLALVLVNAFGVFGQWQQTTTSATEAEFNTSDRYEVNGKLYSILRSTSNGYKASVAMRSGSGWTYDLDGTGGTDGLAISSAMCYSPVMSVDQSNGDIYVAYKQLNTGLSYFIFVQRYDGNTWSTIGGGSINTNNGSALQGFTGGSDELGMKVSNGKVVVVEGSSSADIWYYDVNSSSAWSYLTSGATNEANPTNEKNWVFSYGASREDDPSKGIDFCVTPSGDIYLSYLYNNPRISKYTQSTNSWSQVGNQITYSPNTYYHKVAQAPDGTLYFGAWAKTFGPSTSTLIMYKLVGSTWTNISSGLYSYNGWNNGFSWDFNFNSTSELYVLYEEQYANNVEVKKYNGTSWVLQTGYWQGTTNTYRPNNDYGTRLFLSSSNELIRVSTTDKYLDGGKVYAQYLGANVEYGFFSPGAGVPGTLVYIYTLNPQNVTGVSFNGVSASFTASSTNHVIATVPNGVTTGPITLSSNYGNSTSSFNFNLAYPTLTSFTPTSGQIGASRTLTGTYFSGNGLTSVNSVTFGGVAASTMNVASATSITATVPTGAKTGAIRVSNGSQQSSGESAVTTINASGGFTGWSNAWQTLTNNANTKALTAVKFYLGNSDVNNSYDLFVELHTSDSNPSSANPFDKFNNTTLAKTSQTVNVLPSSANGWVTFLFDGDFIFQPNTAYYAVLKEANTNPSGTGLQRAFDGVTNTSDGGAGNMFGTLAYSFETSPVFTILPTITQTNTGTAFYSCPGGIDAQVETLTLNATNLSADVIVTAPTGYQVSLDQSTWTSS